MGLLFELVAVVLAVLTLKLIDIIHPFAGDARIGEVIFLWVVWNYVLGQISTRYVARGTIR